MRWCAIVILLSSISALAQAKSGQTGPGTASAMLHDLFAAEWDYEMQQRPEEASSLGDLRWNTRWDDGRPEAHAARYQHNQGVLKKLGPT